MKKNIIKTFSSFIKEELNNDELSNNTDIDIDTVSQLYDIYGEYSYACAAVAYFIFGDTEYNLLQKSFKGAYGRGTCIEYVDVSEYMLNYEYSWQYNMEDIDNFIKNMPTKDGGKLSDYY